MSERALVCIPTYNEIVNIPDLVPQVLSQDPRLEILVIDDNSPDGTGRLVEEMACNDPKVHVLSSSGSFVRPASVLLKHGPGTPSSSATGSSRLPRPVAESTIRHGSTG